MGSLINDCDKWLFDSVAQEVNKLAGITAIIYQFDQAASKRDPLWDEEIDTVYKKNTKGVQGVECPVFFKDPDRTAMTGEEGYRLDRISNVFIATKDLEDRGLRVLVVGDIVKIWGQYFDVTESHKAEGNVSDTGVCTSYTFDVVMRTKALPEGIWIE